MVHKWRWQLSDRGDRMVHIDGSEGAGGGQIVRSSLALSLVTGQPVRIDHIRAKRSKPGLMRQHLTSVLAAAELGAAELKGATLGSSRLYFAPQRAVLGGHFEFKIGTAGSTMLVLQTIMPPLLLATESSSITLEGGTHNPLAPPFDFVKQVYAPLLERMGARIEMTMQRPGFYPAGAGRCDVSLTPTSELGQLTLLERGRLIAQRVRAVVAKLPAKIAERECRRAIQSLGWHVRSGHCIAWDDSISPGNVVFVELEFENLTEVFTAFGERGKPAEEVAQEAATAAANYLQTTAPVSEHLADQLLLPLGLGAHLQTGGGAFRTGPLSDHSLTHIALLRQFLEVDITVTALPDDTVLVEVGNAR